MYPNNVVILLTYNDKSHVVLFNISLNPVYETDKFGQIIALKNC
jgi:hypothetical protein